MCDCQADGGDDGHPVGRVVRRCSWNDGFGEFWDLHSIEDHEFTFAAHKFAAPAAGHFGETVDLVS